MYCITCLVLLTFLYHMNFAAKYLKNPKVLTAPCGYLEGINEENIFIFKGIPFAKPPIEDLRWRSPEPLGKEDGSCWKGTFKANKYGNQCYQKNTFINKYLGEEDCLYLNIWTPTLNKTSKLPVMVYIHGGYSMIYNSSVENYSPTSDLTKEANMVFVSMNYRLNAFGYLTLDMLSKRSSDKKSGNYGVKDQISALEWVKENIENFGGDPDKVTIFGQSSGGTAVYALLAAPKAKGLFHRAWAESGSPILNKTMEEASKDNLVFLNKSGCNDVKCLLNLSPLDVYNAIPMDVYPYWEMADLTELPKKGVFDGALLVVDGDVIPKPIIDTIESGEGNDVPVIISTTAQEADLVLPGEVVNWDWSIYNQKVAEHLDTFGKDITKQALIFYPPLDNETPEYQYSTMISDLRVNCFTDVLAKKMASNFKSPIYRLIITSHPSIRMPFLDFPFQGAYAFHGWDSYAFFGVISKVIKNPTAKDLAFQEIIQKNIFNFARTGKVNSKLWLPVQMTTALASDKLDMVKQYHEDECKFWLSHGFGSYSWIN